MQVRGKVTHNTKLQVNVVSIPRGMYYDKNGQLVPRNGAAPCIEGSVNRDGIMAITIEDPTAIDATQATDADAS